MCSNYVVKKSATVKKKIVVLGSQKRNYKVFSYFVGMIINLLLEQASQGRKVFSVEDKLCSILLNLKLVRIGKSRKEVFSVEDKLCSILLNLKLVIQLKRSIISREFTVVGAKVQGHQVGSKTTGNKNILQRIQKRKS